MDRAHWRRGWVVEALNLAEPARPEAEAGGLLRDPCAKLRHMRACLTHPVEYSEPTGLDAFELTNQALAEVSFTALCLTTSLAGRTAAKGEKALREFIESVRALRSTLEPV